MNEKNMSEGIDVIERNTRVQAQLIDDLLDMSRIVSGKVRLNVGEVDLRAVIAAAIQSVLPAAAAKGIRIETQFDEAGGKIVGDRNRLQQIGWNLLNNAIKFTRGQGWVRASIEQVNSRVVLSIADSGIGIEPHFLPHVFERFRQADASTTRHHGGLGLGLAIVKQLVELHGGEVTVQSQGRDKGATFIVSLPIAAVQAPFAAEPFGRRNISLHPTLDSSSLGGIKVLAVDDEPDSLNLIRRVLEEHDAEVRTAGSVKEALQILGSYTPHVLVSDIGMPGQDGYDLVRQVRLLPHGAAISAVALMALARSEDRLRALHSGFQTHIAKPVVPAELCAVVAGISFVRAEKAGTYPV